MTRKEAADTKWRADQVRALRALTDKRDQIGAQIVRARAAKKWPEHQALRQQLYDLAEEIKYAKYAMTTAGLKTAQRRGQAEHIANPTVPNPTGGRGARRQVELITDRAKRYRAQADVPAGPAICVYCGADSELIDHIDGRERNGAPENLARSCRPCNGQKAVEMKRAGMGERTRQFNPAAKPAANIAQWKWATERIRRRDRRTGALLPRDAWKIEAPAAEVRAAVAMIRATPPARRSEFAAMLRSKQTRRPAGDIDMSWLVG